ncbi:glucosamine inositolphosphorylceramide transferase 1 [Impatiens glandulifera]|uniref:glucosamine inositolphosphorylceramide transferase 1 n=1 Tax=Impatiens glandulifera TaxID=253017 RepID=UPI001FB130B5|nr:glucosamine inositolphosphorylceramide transferase 1 [Impatiens glandulifera]
MGSNTIVAGGGHCVMTSTFVFFIVSFTLLGSIATLYAWLILTPPVRTVTPSFGCQEDNEGSWSIGVFYGDSPFSLQPIENVNIWKEDAKAWPVANPIITCASLTDAGFPSNFVADPFLYTKGDELYVFFETKNTITMQGDIAVAKSTDKGATWQPLGIALDEEWHVSYPYVFAYDNEIYMMPEGSAKGDLRLYRAIEFPLRWKMERVIMKRPLVDSSIVEHEGKYWLFGSDHSGIGTKKNGHLGIWYSNSPIGPWRPHKRNPIYNTDKSMGARNGGRPFTHEGKLYRLGQDCGETYGKRLRLFQVDVLTAEEYKEMEVPFDLIMPTKGRNAWNGARYHHLDVQKLPSGEWIGIADGDRVPSGDLVRRFVLGCSSLMALVFIVVLIGVLFGIVKCVVPLSWCPHNMEKRSDSFLDLEKSKFYSSRVRKLCTRFNRAISFLQSRIRLNSCAGKFVLVAVFLIGVSLAITSVRQIYGGNGAEEPYPLNGLYSQFTMLTMTYDARLWNLKMYVKHYSRCSSVKEIVVVWNKGNPPKPSEFDSVVPVRIRVEERNSLNNRFKMDNEIKTRGVLELDDDIMMPCGDIERGFKVWREHPERIVGFYPRLVDGITTQLKYRGEKHARSGKGYNMILTGAAFIDSRKAFERYWSEEAKVGREFVDKNFNCEDILLNYLYANGSKFSTVEYVRPTWAIDTSKFSNVAISRNTDEHYRVRSNCLERFAEAYGSLSRRKSEFSGREDGWDL